MRLRRLNTSPAAGDAWQTVAPRDAGFDAGKLADAIGYANAHECNWPHSMYLDSGEYVGTAYVQEKPPYNTVIGEVRPRGGVNGVILRGGRIVAEWGDTRRTDMTFSCAKSYIALVAGLAFDRGLLSLDDRVADTVPDDGFASPHNQAITWRHLLQQTSEWQGVLWDKPDSVDHNRQVGLGNDNSRKGTVRALERPGTRFEYNDVRVNRLALSLLRLLRRPLPEVLREAIMDPIGASDSWVWRGYRNSTVEIDGTRMESVSGGGHWGGGLFISSRDHARVGQLVLRRGVVERAATRLGAMAARAHDTVRHQSRLRVPVVAQHRPQARAIRPRIEHLRARRRAECDLDRCRA